MDICIPNMSTFIQEHCQLLTLDLKLPVILNQAPLGKFPFHYLCHILSLCANVNMFSDALIHHIWNSRPDSCSFQSYSECIETIRKTPRVWNSDQDLKKVLTSLTWSLNININLIGVKRVRDSVTCLHFDKTKQCMFPFYIFQNTVLKLQNTSIYDCITVLWFENNYYLITSKTLYPILLKQDHSLSVEFHNIQVSAMDVTKMFANHDSINFPFSIAVYSTFSYVTPSQIKAIKKHLIHFYKGPHETETLHLFLSPYTNNNEFTISRLKNISSEPIDFSHKNNYVNPHLTEGTRKEKSKKSTDQQLLNQNYCICEHFETTRLYLPKPTSFRCLGKLFTYLPRFV